MILASQVFPILSGAASESQVLEAVKSTEKYLFDQKIGGYRLNTDFSRSIFKRSGGIPLKAGKIEQHTLGRAFSFVYGDKENGAIFSHMVVMYAYSLYGRGLVNQGWRALSSLYKLTMNVEKSKIYPCLPEYFDTEGRGMYSYLTGSASWFVLTILTQAFGLYGRDGEFIIEPKLTKEQFLGAAKISISRDFAGRHLLVNFINPEKLEYGIYKIMGLMINSAPFSITPGRCLVIGRKIILRLPVQKINVIDVILG
jgi:cellobiose phosphorylase